MKQIDFYFIFELTPDDLFVMRGEKIFFLVVFYKNNPINSFLLGSNFLKKYLFYFDNDKNQFVFLRVNISKNGKNEVIVVYWYNSPGTVIILIILDEEFSYDISKDKKMEESI